jgi:serine/threonine protein kinase
MVDAPTVRAEVTANVEPGAVVADRYRVRREIARGGMSVVLEVEHLHLGRRMALKLPCAREHELGWVRARFMREARALELSRGPNVVDVTDAGYHEGEAYLALEMLEGRALDALLAARRRLPLEVATLIVVELCEALTSVHRAGIVHRDLKPSNVFVTKLRGGGEQTKLLDFGVASVPHEADAPKLTQVGDRLGTLEYMAPEQLLGEPVDPSTDLFSLGLLFYECVVGEPPFPGGGPELLKHILGGHPLPPISRALVSAPPGLDALVSRMLGRDRAARPVSAAALAKELLMVTGVQDLRLRVLETPPPIPNRAEVRHFARAPYVAPIRVLDEAGVSLDGQTADLSEGGLLVMLERPLEPGRTFTLRVGLPMSGRVSALRGVVRWARAARHRHAIGFELVSPAEEAVTEIRRFVALSLSSPSAA